MSNPSPNRNARTWAYKEQLKRLPLAIQARAEGAFSLFQRDPAHPSLRLHRLEDNGRGNHLMNSFSVSINMSYRAIYTVVDGVNLWYWVGSHTDYDTFLGRK